MTNHKIKDYHKNRLAFEVIVKNYEMLCSLLIVLNKKYPKTFYPKKCRQWIDDFADNCKIANEWDKDGVYAYKMQRACENSGIAKSSISRTGLFWRTTSSWRLCRPPLSMAWVASV